MLIRSLRAEGFLKFRKIRIENFPRRGLIGIVGPNESGKSTIGQLFQFALFGTTHHVVRGSVIDLIHWEDDHCVVELDLEHDGEGFRIWREMDRLGTSFARLMRISKPGGAPGEELASGIIQVQREVQRRFHLAATETLQSFYLAEHESVTNPEKFRAYLDRVAGIDVLQGARSDAKGALDLLEKEFTSVQEEIHRNELHASKLQPNIDKIPDLEKDLSDRDSKVEEARSRVSSFQGKVEQEQKKRDEVQKIQQELRSLDTMVSRESLRKCNGLIGLFQSDLTPEALRNQDSVIASLKKGLERLATACKLRNLLDDAVKSARDSLQVRLDQDGDGSIAFDLLQEKEKGAATDSSRIRNRAIAAILFLLGISGLVLGIDHQYEWGVGEYVPLLKNLNLEARVGYLVAAGGAAILCLACWFASLASIAKQNKYEVESNVSRLSMEKEVGKTSLAAAGAHLSLSLVGLDPGDEVSECRDSEVQKTLEALRKSRRDIHSMMGDKPGDFLSKVLKNPLDKIRSRLKEKRKGLDEANDSVKRLRSKRDRIQGEIREYQNQDGRRRALEEFSNGLRKKSLAIREDMDIHRLLVELLDETIESVRMRAGPSLGKGLCRLLPHLTGDRYRDAQVTPEFEIRLFTGEKSDFLQAHELSGGTLQGVSFGFRLAFAQAFVRAVTGAPQFLFLDEPFPAMDRKRVLRTLQALPRLSRELSQVIVAHPDLDESAQKSFDLLIETEVGVGRLEIDLNTLELPEIPAPAPDVPTSSVGKSSIGEVKPRGSRPFTDLSSPGLKSSGDFEKKAGLPKSEVADESLKDSGSSAGEVPEPKKQSSSSTSSSSADSTPSTPRPVDSDDWTIPEA